MSEKLVNAYLGESGMLPRRPAPPPHACRKLTVRCCASVPIFFGGVDIPDQLNQKAFVYCNITYDYEWELPTIAELQKLYPDELEFKTTVFGSIEYETYSQYEQKMNITDFRVARLLPKFRKQAQPCLDRIIELDSDDDKYKEALSQSLVKGDSLEGTMFDFNILGQRVRKAMETVEVSNLRVM